MNYQTVTIKLANGRKTKKNLEALLRVLQGQKLSLADGILIADTITILRAIAREMGEDL